MYDAVAGRINALGFIPDTPLVASTRDTASTSSVPIPPEEVLFRRKHAPTRYEEDDVYFQDRHIPLNVKLPDSDLLKAVHGYASHFYAGVNKERAKKRRKEDKHDQSERSGTSGDWESMDETALLAMGILIEETAGTLMEKDGRYRDFLEKQEEEGSQADDGPRVWNGNKWVLASREDDDQSEDSGEGESSSDSDEDEETESAFEDNDTSDDASTDGSQSDSASSD